MAWRCSFGVVNCPICMRPMETDEQIKAKQKQKAKEIVQRVTDGLLNGRIKPYMKANGKIGFSGLTMADRAEINDDAINECIYKAIMRDGSQVAKLKLQQAMANRAVNRQSIGG